MGDIDYLAAMHHVILPIARLYQPQLVLVSAGFDAAEGDAIGEYHVSKEGFSHMTHLLGALAQEKLVLCLEGGYDVDALSSCAKACLRTLLDGRPTLLPTVSPIKGKRLSPSRQATRVFKKVLESQKKYMPDLATPDSFVLPTDEYITIAKGLIRKEGRLRPRRS
jgi:histone deacetylase 6